MLRFSFVLAAATLLATAAAAESLEVAPGADQAGAKRLAKLMDINRDGVILVSMGISSPGRARW